MMLFSVLVVPFCHLQSPFGIVLFFIRLLLIATTTSSWSFWNGNNHNNDKNKYGIAAFSYPCVSKSRFCVLRNACFSPGGDSISTADCFEEDRMLRPSLVGAEMGDSGRSNRMIGVESCKPNRSEIKQGIYLHKDRYRFYEISSSRTNYGHILGDEIWTIFSRMFELNLHFPQEAKDRVTILMSHEDQAFIEANTKVQEFYRLISHRKIEYIHLDSAIADASSSPTPAGGGGGGAAAGASNGTNHHRMDNTAFCYERLIVGWSKLSYWQNKNDEVISLPRVIAFRQAALDHAGIIVFPSGANNTFASRGSRFSTVGSIRNASMSFGRGGHDDSVLAAMCKVIIVVKDPAVAEHAYGIGNVPELMAHLKRKTEGLCSAETVCWSSMTLKEQIRAVHDKRIMVSLPGSDIMNNIFQPIHSGLIVPDRCKWSNKTPDSKNQANSSSFSFFAEVEGWVCEESNEHFLWYSKIPFRHYMRLPRSEHLVWQKRKELLRVRRQRRNPQLIWDVDHFVEAVLVMAKRIADDLRVYPSDP